MTWYKILIATNRDDYLRSLGATEDIINYINSVDQSISQSLVNEFRKNPQLTVLDLQQFYADLGQAQTQEPWYDDLLIILSNRYPFNMRQWICNQLRKILNLRGTQEKHGIKSINLLCKEQDGVLDKLHEISDWISRSPENIDINSYSFEQAVAASDEWHIKSAQKGEGENYRPTIQENIIVGTEWTDPESGEPIPEWQGWTIQKINSSNDLLVEGNLMSHCIGDYSEDLESGNSIFYSLRDPSNKPHISIETDGTGELVRQIQGNSNQEPKKQYKDMIKNWVRKYQCGDIPVGIKEYEEERNEELLDYLTDATHPEEIVNTLEELLSDSDYGLETKGIEGEIELIFEHSLKVLNSRSHHGEYNGDRGISDILSEETVKAGDEHIDELLELIEKEEKETEEYMMYQDISIDEPYPQEENFETTEEYEKAEDDWRDLEQNARDEIYNNSLPGGWLHELYQDITREIQEQRNMDMTEWWENFGEPIRNKKIEIRKKRREEKEKREKQLTAQVTKNWYKIANLNVTPLGFNSYGELSLDINGKQYRYLIQYPYNPQEVAREIQTYNAKGWGKKVKKIIDWLDQFLIK